MGLKFSLIIMLWFFIFGLSENKTDSSSDEPAENYYGISVALHIFLPIAGFCILWGRRDIFTRLLLQIDRSCISVCCPSFSKREQILRWITESLPSSTRSYNKTIPGGIPSLWKDGSTLCILINSIVPGACPNPPRHWKKPPSHAQALAYKYLGIVPVFTESDFEGPFSPLQERKFLIYLEEIQQTIKKLSMLENSSQVTSRYLARGMGLFTGEQHKKNSFYIYSNSRMENQNVMVYIRGPYGTQGTATVPAFHNAKFSTSIACLHKRIKKEENQKSFLQSMSFDFSFFKLDKKNGNNDIVVHVEMELDRAKVTYIPKNYGMFEIHLLSDGEILEGSPFVASIVKNVSGEQENFENTKDVIDNFSTKITRKKILSKIIDCVDNKIELFKADKLNNDVDHALSKFDENAELEKMDELKPLDVKIKNKLADMKLNNENLHNSHEIAMRNTKNFYVKNKDPRKELIANSTMDTSTICSAHIAREVEDNCLKNLTALEKRKRFAKTQEICRDDWSLSENESDAVSEAKTMKLIHNLNVMAVLETLKKSSRSVSADSSLTPSKSLTSVCSDDDLGYSFRNSFLKTREYWKNVSSTSLADSSWSGSACGKMKRDFDIRRSADDILGLGDFSDDDLKSKKCASRSVVDLSRVSFIGIEERKKMLWGNVRQPETCTVGRNFRNKKIARYCTSFEQQPPPIKKQPSPKTSSSSFKETVAFFKNLEKRNRTASKSKKQRNVVENKRRHSLNIETQNRHVPQKFGSLRLFTTKEKFSLSKIYVDVTSNKRGSLKGAPNGDALSDTLASLTRIENKMNNNGPEFDNNIKLNLFFNKAKSKKRKSVKSVFDVFY